MYVYIYIQALLYSRTSESVLCGQSAQSSARAEMGLAVIRMMEIRFLIELGEVINCSLSSGSSFSQKLHQAMEEG